MKLLKILKMEVFDKEKRKTTISHILSRRTEWITKEKDILQLKDSKGWTVAHILALNKK